MAAAWQRQHGFGVRFYWGLSGAAALAADADVVVLVDVLTFTTTVSVALDRGIEVLPYAWDDPTAEAYANEHHATLALPRLH